MALQSRMVLLLSRHMLISGSNNGTELGILLMWLFNDILMVMFICTSLFVGKLCTFGKNVLLGYSR